MDLLYINLLAVEADIACTNIGLVTRQDSRTRSRASVASDSKI